jgi:hypothetical protein
MNMSTISRIKPSTPQSVIDAWQTATGKKVTQCPTMVAKGTKIKGLRLPPSTTANVQVAA